MLPRLNVYTLKYIQELQDCQISKKKHVGGFIRNTGTDSIPSLTFKQLIIGGCFCFTKCQNKYQPLQNEIDSEGKRIRSQCLTGLKWHLN